LVYNTPGKTKNPNPFIIDRTYYGAYNETTCIDWTTDSKAFLVGGKDMNSRVYAAMKANFVVYSLGGHKEEIKGCFFDHDSLDVYSVSRDGVLNAWECSFELSDIKPKPKYEYLGYEKQQEEGDKTADDGDVIHSDEGNESGSEHESGTEDDSDKSTSGGDVVNAEGTVETSENAITAMVTENQMEEAEEKIHYKRVAKHFFNKEGDFNNVTCVAFHKKSHILVTGFASGAFYLHELPDFNLIHSLSISEHQITSATFNMHGEWLALASANLGQLVVWEWKSESFIMKQQGHFSTMTCMDYSPSAFYIATGAEDGKVKVWNTRNGFCFVTFKDHTAGVKAVKFTSNGQVIISASLDGTVRAFDMNRYRNFRTFTSPRPTQFLCLDVDKHGELVCAGSQTEFEVYVWSMRTGRLLDVLSGHQAPVVSLCFTADASMLATGSWDNFVMLWRIGDEKRGREPLEFRHDVLAICSRPDGKEIAVSTLNAEITFWDVQSATQTGSIDCRADIFAGRGETDKVSAKTSSFGKAYETLCYTADGQTVLAGGKTKYICLYHVKQKLLIKRFEVSNNLSFNSMEEFLDKRRMTDSGIPLADIDMEETDQLQLPGVRNGDMSKRAFRPEISVAAVRFSPTGEEWAAVTTEGLLLYSFNSSVTFDPFHLDVDVTPKNIRQQKLKKEWMKAIVMSFRLNDNDILREVIESVPHTEIEELSKFMPLIFVEKLLRYVADRLDNSTHLHFYLLWLRHLLLHHGPALKKNSTKLFATLTHLQKSLTKKSDDIIPIINSSYYQLQYIATAAAKRQKRKPLEVDENSEEDSGHEYVEDFSEEMEMEAPMIATT